MKFHLLKISVLVSAVYLLPVALDSLMSSVGVKGFVGSAQAQVKPRRLPGISEPFLKSLNKVQEFTSPDEEKNPGAVPDFDAALAELAKMEKRCRDKCNDYELAQIYRFYGFAYYSKNNYRNAIKYFDLVVKQSPNIPFGVEKITLDSLAQLCFAEGMYDRALGYLNKWIGLIKLEGKQIPPEVLVTRARIYYQKGDKKNAIKDIDSAVKLKETAGQKVREDWYVFQKGVHLEAENYKTSLSVLEKLVRQYPKKKYWSELSGVFGRLNRLKDQMAALDALHVMDGLENKSDIVNFAVLNISEGAPYKGAKVLAKGIKDKIVASDVKNLEMLAKGWGLAKEYKKAIDVLKQATVVSAKNPSDREKTKTGDLYSLMSTYYLDLDDSKNAIDAGKKGLSAGPLKDAGALHVNMGIAYADLKQFNNCISAFGKAMEYKKHRRFASNWRTFCEQEKKRSESLASTN